MPPNTSDPQRNDRRKTHALEKEGDAEGRQARVAMPLCDARGAEGDGAGEVDEEDDARFDVFHQAWCFVPQFV